MYHYKEKKKKKLAKLVRDGRDFLLTVIKFDPETGERKEPVMFLLEKANVEQRKAEFEKQAEDLGVLLKDMEALERQK